MILFTIAPCERFLYRYKTELLHGLLNGFADWYIYVYMYCWERRTLCVTLFFYISERNDCVTTILLFIHFTKFHLEVTSPHHVHSIYGTEESSASWGNLSFIIWYICKYKQLHYEKYFIMFLLLNRGMTKSWSFLITISIVSLFGHLFIWWHFTMLPFSTGLITLVIVYAITCTTSIACMINFNPCLVSNLLGTNYEYYDDCRFCY